MQETKKFIKILILTIIGNIFIIFSASASNYYDNFLNTKVENYEFKSYENILIYNDFTKSNNVLKNVINTNYKNGNLGEKDEEILKLYKSFIGNMNSLFMLIYQKETGNIKFNSDINILKFYSNAKLDYNNLILKLGEINH